MHQRKAGHPHRRRRRLRFAVAHDVREGVARVEAYSDGVFAIAATLLVLEIKIPGDVPDAAALRQALTKQWPAYLSYVLSFTYLGTYWAHHHNVFRHYRRTDHIFLKLNLLFLMLIAVFPFPTGMLGAYLRAHDEREQIAAVVYNGLSLVTGAVFLGMWVYATGRCRLVDHDMDAALIRLTTLRYTIAPVGYALAFAVAFWSADASLVINLLVTLFYLLPLQVSVE
jgi:uncharacterized membrane protein